MQPEQLSLEAVEELAHRWLTEQTFGPDKSAPHYQRALKSDPSVALLIARSRVKSLMVPLGKELDRGWSEPPLALAKQPPFNAQSLTRLLESEPSAAKRQALWALATERAQDTFAKARAAVQGIRGLDEEFKKDGQNSVFAALGLTLKEPAPALAQQILNITQDVFIELDHWAIKQAGIETARRSLRWHERAHTLLHPRAAGLIAMGDRSASFVRWTEHCGLSYERTLLQDHVGASRPDATGVRLQPQDRLRVIGEENSSLRATLAIAHTMGSAIALARGWTAPMARHRWGVDQIAPQVWGSLVEQLCFTESFAFRELGVDRSQTEWITRGGLHSWLYQLRVNAARTLSAQDALEGTAGLSERYRDRMMDAIACAEEPVWTVHRAANILTDCAETQLWAQLFASWAWLSLREDFQEDWFRNPHCGEPLGRWLDSARLLGVEPWFRSNTSGKPEDNISQLLLETLRKRIQTANVSV